MAFLTNFTESLFGRIIPTELSEKMPNTAGLIGKTRENFTEAGGVLDKINGKIDTVKDSFKDLSKIHKNALSQIKSGKFGEKVSDKTGGMGDFGGLDDWGNDDWGSSNNDDWGSDSGDGGSSEYGDVNNEVNNNYESNYTSNNYDGGSENVTAAVTTQTGITAGALASLGTLLSDVSKQVQLLNVFHNEKTSEYYEASLDSFKSIAEFNTKLDESLKPVIEYYEEIAEKKRNAEKIKDEFDISEILNPAYHLNKVLDSQFLSDEMIGMLTKGVSDTITDPIGMLAKSVLFGSVFNKGFIPTVAGGKMKRFDEFVEYLPYVMQSKLQQWSNNRDHTGETYSAQNILAFLGDTFKMDVPTARLQANIDKDTEATFDARTRRAIITEIPIYLSKLLKESQISNVYLKKVATTHLNSKELEAEVSGIENEVFDSERGRFIKIGKKKEELNKRIKEVSQNKYSGGFANELESFIYSMKSETRDELFGKDPKETAKKMEQITQNLNKIVNSTLVADADWTNGDDIMLRVDTILEEEARKEWEKKNKDSRPTREMGETDGSYERKVNDYEKNKEKEIKAMAERSYGPYGKDFAKKVVAQIAKEMSNEDGSEERDRQAAEIKYNKALQAARSKKNPKDRAEAENEAKKVYNEEMDAAANAESTIQSRFRRSTILGQTKQKEETDGLNKEIAENTSSEHIMALEGDNMEKITQHTDIRSPTVFEAQNLIDRFFDRGRSKASNEIGNLFEDIGRYVTNKVETGIEKGVKAIDWTYTKLSNVGNYATAALMMTYSSKDWDALLKDAENQSFFDAMSTSFDQNLFTPLKKFMLGTDDPKELEKFTFIGSMQEYFDKKIMTPLNKFIFGADSDKTVWDSITESFSSMTEKVTNYITEDLFGAAKSVLGEVGIQVQNAFQGVKKFLFEDLTEGTKSVFNSVFGENAIDTIRSTLVEPFTNAVNKLTETVGSMIKWVFSLPIKLLNGITNFSQSVRGVSTTDADDSNAKVITSTEKLTRLKDDSDEDTRNKFSKVGELVRDNATLHAKYKELAAQKSINIAESLNDFDDSQSLKANILSQLKADNLGEEFEAQAEEIADFIIAGMVGEIAENGSEISEVVKTNLGTEPLSAIRAAWDIHSPSREMIEVAKFIREGFVLGLNVKDSATDIDNTIFKVFAETPKEILSKAYGMNKGKSKFMSDFATNLVRTFIDTLLSNKKSVKDYFDSVFKLPIDVGSVTIKTNPAINHEALVENTTEVNQEQHTTTAESRKDEKAFSSEAFKATNRILLSSLGVQKEIKVVLGKILEKTGRIISTEGGGRFADFKNNPFAYLGDQFGRLLQGPVAIVGKLAESFGDFLEKVKDIPAKFMDIAADAAHGFAEGLKRMLPGLGSFIENSLGAITKMFSTTLQHSADWVEQIFDRMGDGAEKLFSNFKKIIQPFADTLQEGMKVFFDKMEPSLEKLGGALNHVVIGLTEFGTKIFDTLLVAGNKVLDFGSGLFDYLRGKDGGSGSVLAGSDVTKVNVINWATSFGTKTNPIFVRVIDGKIETYSKQVKEKRKVSFNNSDIQESLLPSAKDTPKKEEDESDSTLAGVAAGAVGTAIAAAGSKLLPSVFGAGSGNKVQSTKDAIYGRLGTNNGSKFSEFSKSAARIEDKASVARQALVPVETDKQKEKRLKEENKARNQTMRKLREEDKKAAEKAKAAAERARQEQEKTKNKATPKTSTRSPAGRLAEAVESNAKNVEPSAKPSVMSTTPIERATNTNRPISGRALTKIEELSAKGKVIPERLLRQVNNPSLLTERARENLQRSRTYHARSAGAILDRTKTTGSLYNSLGTDQLTAKDKKELSKAYRNDYRGKELSESQRRLLDRARAGYNPNLSQREIAAREYTIGRRGTLLGKFQNLSVATNNAIEGTSKWTGGKLKSGGKGLTSVTDKIGSAIRTSGSNIRSGQYRRALSVNPENLPKAKTFTSQATAGAERIGGSVGKTIKNAGAALQSNSTTKFGRIVGGTTKMIGGATEFVGKHALGKSIQMPMAAASYMTNKAVGAGVSVAGAGVQAAGRLAGTGVSMLGSGVSTAGKVLGGIRNMSMGASLGLGIAGGLGSMAADSYLTKGSTEHRLAKATSGLASDLGIAASLNAIPVLGQIASALYLGYVGIKRIPELFKSLVAFVEDKFKDQINGMTTFFLELPDKITGFTERLPEIIEGMGNELTSAIDSMFSGPTEEDFDPETGLPIDSGKPSILWQLAKAFGKAIISLGVNLPGILLKLGEGLVKAVTGFLTKAWIEWIPNIFSTIMNSFTETFSEIFDSMSSWADELWWDIKHPFANKEEKAEFNREQAAKKAEMDKKRREESFQRAQEYVREKKERAEKAEAAKNSINSVVGGVSDSIFGFQKDLLNKVMGNVLNDNEAKFANRYRESMEASGGDESRSKIEYAKKFLNMSDADIEAASKNNTLEAKINEGGGFTLGKTSFEKVIKESEERRFIEWRDKRVESGDTGSEDEFRERYKVLLENERNHKGKDVLGGTQSETEIKARNENKAQQAAAVAVAAAAVDASKEKTTDTTSSPATTATNAIASSDSVISNTTTTTTNAAPPSNGVGPYTNLRTSNRSSYSDAQVAEAIYQASKATGVDHGLLFRMAVLESNLNPDANRNDSSKGAKGLFQFLPETAKRMNLRDVYNPYESALAGAQYIKVNFKELNKDIPRNALTAYLSHQQGAGGLNQIWASALSDNNPNRLLRKRRENMAANSPFGDSALHTPQEFIAGWQKKLGEPSTLFANIDTSKVQVNSNIGKIGSASVMPSLGSNAANDSSYVPIQQTPAEVAQTNLPKPPPDPMLRSNSASMAMSMGGSTTPSPAPVVNATPSSDAGIIGTSVASSNTPSPSTYAPQQSAQAVNSTVNSYQTAQASNESLMLEELRKQSTFLSSISGNTEALKKGISVSVVNSDSAKISSQAKVSEENVKQNQPTVDFFGNLINGHQKQSLNPSPAALKIAAGGTM